MPKGYFFMRSCARFSLLLHVVHVVFYRHRRHSVAYCGPVTCVLRVPFLLPPSHLEKSILYPNQALPPPLYTNFSQLHAASQRGIPGERKASVPSLETPVSHADSKFQQQQQYSGVGKQLVGSDEPGVSPRH